MILLLNEGETDPIITGDILINSLLYADYIIVLSSSQQGPQNSLDICYNFYSSGKLEISEKNLK